MAISPMLTDEPPPRAIGIIASDEYGPAVAERLAKAGQRVLYWALPGGKPVPKQPFIETVSTPTDIAFECDVVLAIVEDTTSLRALLLGSAEQRSFGAEMRPGAVLIDLGARTPRELHALLGILGTRGIAIVDAALLGNVNAVLNGQSRVLLGGFIDSIDIALPALRHLGSVERTGPLGSAHAAAALMGYLETAHIVAREQARELGRACGLPLETLNLMLKGEPESDHSNVVRLARQAALARRIAKDRGISADIIDLMEEKRRRAAETR